MLRTRSFWFVTAAFTLAISAVQMMDLGDAASSAVAMIVVAGLLLGALSILLRVFGISPRVDDFPNVNAPSHPPGTFSCCAGRGAHSKYCLRDKTTVDTFMKQIEADLARQGVPAAKKSDADVALADLVRTRRRTPVHPVSNHVFPKYIHTGHPLDGHPLYRRETGLLEVTCPHGVGHPIPESVEWMERRRGGGGSWGVHGCCGCCRAK